MTYVLIPGAGGAGVYWHRVATELASRGHGVISLDLPAGDDQAGFGEYADVVIEAASGLPGGEPPTLVAQSMGGFTAVLVAERMPVREIVFVNAMIPRVGETAGEWWGNTGQKEAQRRNDVREGRDPDAEFDIGTVFMHDLPQAEVDALMAAGETAQGDKPFTEPYPLKRWPDTPMRAISATGDRLFPLEFQRRLVGDRLGAEPAEVPGGHLVALSQPAALVDQIVGV